MISIKPFDIQDKELCQLWDDFCLYESNAWFWHTTQWLKYTLAYRTDRQPYNLSFMVMDEDQVVGIVPLIRELVGTNEGTFHYEFSYGAGPVPAPVYSKYLIDQVVKCLSYDEIERLARTNFIAYGEFQQSPLMGLVDEFSGWGYNLTNGHSQILTLDRPFEAIIRQMRKGHAYDVKRGVRDITVNLYDAQDYPYASFVDYRFLHAKANERTCRSAHTFDLQLDWLTQGNAILVEALNELDVPIGFIYIFLYKNGAYFGSACNDPAYRHLPIGHALQGHAIQWLLAHGYKQYELGLQYDETEKATDKERAVAHFKHGFGGVTVPVYKWEKFYDQTKTPKKEGSDQTNPTTLPFDHQRL